MRHFAPHASAEKQKTQQQQDQQQQAAAASAAEKREKRDERIKRETSTTKIRREIEGCNDSIPEWRDGTKKVGPLEEDGREQRKDTREKAMVRSLTGGMVEKRVGH